MLWLLLSGPTPLSPPPSLFKLPFCKTLAYFLYVFLDILLLDFFSPPGPCLACGHPGLLALLPKTLPGCSSPSLVTPLTPVPKTPGVQNMTGHGGWPFLPPPEVGAQKPQPITLASPQGTGWGRGGAGHTLLFGSGCAMLRWKIEGLSLAMTGLITACLSVCLIALEMGKGRGDQTSQPRSKD